MAANIGASITAGGASGWATLVQACLWWHNCGPEMRRPRRIRRRVPSSEGPIQPSAPVSCVRKPWRTCCGGRVRAPFSPGGALGAVARSQLLSSLVMIAPRAFCACWGTSLYDYSMSLLHNSQISFRSRCIDYDLVNFASMAAWQTPNSDGSYHAPDRRIQGGVL